MFLFSRFHQKLHQQASNIHHPFSIIIAFFVFNISFPRSATFRFNIHTLPFPRTATFLFWALIQKQLLTLKCHIVPTFKYCVQATYCANIYILKSDWPKRNLSFFLFRLLHSITFNHLEQTYPEEWRNVFRKCWITFANKKQM